MTARVVKLEKTIPLFILFCNLSWPREYCHLWISMKPNSRDSYSEIPNVSLLT